MKPIYFLSTFLIILGGAILETHAETYRVKAHFTSFGKTLDMRCRLSKTCFGSTTIQLKGKTKSLSFRMDLYPNKKVVSAVLPKYRRPNHLSYTITADTGADGRFTKNAHFSQKGSFLYKEGKRLGGDFVYWHSMSNRQKQGKLIVTISEFKMAP